MARYSVVRYADPHQFAKDAVPWLLQAEAEHNLLLGIVDQLKSTRNAHSAYLATIAEPGGVVGCAFRTPPYKLGVTRMPVGAIADLVNDVTEVYDELPAVMGPAAQARAFAEAWAACRDRSVRPGLHSRIYELRRVQPPDPIAPGAVRLATVADTDRLVDWLNAFATEAGVGHPHGRGFAENHIANRTVFLWEDEGEPRTSALFAGKTPHGVRVGFVYTPPEFRRRGYATACVAAVSQRALDAGNQFCCLYTDLSNPTSNSIYQRIGYTAVCDVMDYEIS